MAPMLKTGFFRKWGGTVLAALLALAVLMPAIDTFVCIGDADGKPSVTQVAGTTVSKETPVQQHDDGDSSCIHGHCHHWVGYTRFAERVAFSTDARSADPIPGAYEQRPSAPQLELLRPPRA